MPSSTPVPILSHSSSRAVASSVRSALPADSSLSRPISVGLRRSSDDEDEDGFVTAATAATAHSTDAYTAADSSPAAASPPSPSTESHLALSLNALALASPPKPVSSLTSLLSSSASPSSPPSSASPPDVISPSLVSEQLLSLYEQTLHKVFVLRSNERTLSAQSGQLLKALQAEEALLNALNATLRRIRHEHKKLLGRITSPRWEVRHHYHMTCMEHSLGHRQPHVMDVAEMLPGHLRLYAIARCHALVKRQMTGGVMRAKGERNSAAEQIKEGYRQLRETRAEIKELGRLLEAMNAKTHLLSSADDQQRLDAVVRKHKRQLSTISSNASAKQAMKGGPAVRGGPGAAGADAASGRGRDGVGAASLASPTNATSIRMRYLKSLNMAPRPYDARGDGQDASSGVKEERRRVVQSVNDDWRVMTLLFNKLEQQKKRREEAAAQAAAAAGDSKEDAAAAALAAKSMTPSPISSTPLSSLDTLAVTDEELAGSPSDSQPVLDVEGELRIVQSYRKRMGLVTLPSPLTFASTEDGLRDSLDPNDAVVQEKDDTDREVNGLLAAAREITEPASPIASPYSASSPVPSSPSSPPAAHRRRDSGNLGGFHLADAIKHERKS